jgi:hypothetical protein
MEHHGLLSSRKMCSGRTVHQIPDMLQIGG